MDSEKLKGYMKINGDDFRSLAAALGINYNTLYLKTSPRSNCCFNQNEINIIRERYRLTPEELFNVFFAKGGDNGCNT